MRRVKVLKKMLRVPFVTLLTSLTREDLVKTRVKLHEKCCNCVSVSNFAREVVVLYFLCSVS